MLDSIIIRTLNEFLEESLYGLSQEEFLHHMAGFIV
jgi:hypothetical protein